MGYVYRDKTTRNWMIRWDDPPGPNGERRERKKSMRKLGNTREIAKAELARIETEINQRKYVRESNTTLSKLIDRWLSECAPEIHEVSTRETDRYIIEAHIRPSLGSLLLQDIEPLHVQDFYTKTLRKKKKLASKTVRNIHGVLSAIFKQGVLWRMIQINPATGVVLPKREKPDRRAATVTETGLILARIETSKYRMPFLIALETGMRRQEIIGLRWEDLVEWKVGERTFHGFELRRAVIWTKDTGVYIKSTKTQAGSRPVMISDWLFEQLRIHRKSQMILASEANSRYKDQGWMCSADDGGLIIPKQLTRAFTYLSDKLGIKLRLHELRHTQASVLADRGIRTALIMERSGWVDERMLGVYGHTTPDMQEDAVAAMSTFLDEAREAARKASSE